MPHEVRFGNIIIEPADKILQFRESSLIDSIRVIDAVIETLEGMRNDTSFDDIFHKITTALNINSNDIYKRQKQTQSKQIVDGFHNC